jgi:hypothetical protein
MSIVDKVFGKYKDIEISEDLDEKANIIKMYLGKQAKIFDSTYSEPLCGKIEPLTNPYEYAIDPFLGSGIILFSRNLTGLEVKI